ncbi:MAG: transglycosylase domain-containing protein [Bacteroidota bacterium]
MFEFLPGYYNKVIRNLWRTAIIGLVSLILFVTAVNYNFFWLFGGMPSLKILENPESELSSELISEDNVVLGKYFLENRTLVEYKELPETITNALFATEDVRFYKHSGIDARGLFRSALGVLTFNQSKGGASTLTQQVAKNLFDTRKLKYYGLLSYVPIIKLFIFKTKEWITAMKLERNYTKEEIAEMYLNTVSFGNNAFGIKSAAKIYFNKSLNQLSAHQAALLIGMLQNPTQFNPRNRPENALARRNVVISQMAKYGYIEQEKSLALQSKPLDLNFKYDDHNTSLAPYLTSVIQDDVEKIVDELNLTRNEDDQLDINTSGLKIYTTVNSKMQTYAEEAIQEHMMDQQKKFDKYWGKRNPWVDENGKEIKNFIFNVAKRTQRYQELKSIYGDDLKAIDKAMNTQVKMKIFTWSGEKDTLMTPIDSIKYYKRFLNTGFMAMNPKNGHLKAWVGGINFKYFKYDHVRQSKRQPGSTFKPFIYTAAFINNAFSPCDTVTDQPVTFGAEDGLTNEWTPKNSEGVYSYQNMTLRRAMGRSVNTVAAYLMKKTGPEKVLQFAREMGITSNLPALPSLCLGTGEVSLYEMVAAYCTFVNQGIYTEPIIITRVEDKHGNILIEKNTKTHDAISKDIAYQMLHMLKGSLQEPGGTSNALNSYNFTKGNDVGGKTGTTSNYSDAWYMGVTNELVAGIWVGGDDRSIHFRSLAMGQGSRQAMPGYAKFMEKAFGDAELGLKKSAFIRPAEMSVSLDCSKNIPDSTATFRPTQNPNDEGILK